MTDLRARIKPKRKILKIALGVGLFAGLLLIAFDLTGMAATEFVVATKQLLPGDKLGADNTKLVGAELGASATAYLDASAVASRSEGMFAVRPIGAGELVPNTAITSVGSLELASIAVTFENPLAANLMPGSRCDLYATRLLSGAQISEPQLIASGTWIRNIRDEESVGRNIQVVELGINRLFLSEVLASMARSDFLTLVASPDAG